MLPLASAGSPWPKTLSGSQSPQTLDQTSPSAKLLIPQWLEEAHGKEVGALSHMYNSMQAAMGIFFPSQVSLQIIYYQSWNDL